MNQDWILVLMVVGSGICFILAMVAMWAGVILVIGFIGSIIYLIFKLLYLVCIYPFILLFQIIFFPPVFWGLVVGCSILVYFH